MTLTLAVTSLFPFGDSWIKTFPHLNTYSRSRINRDLKMLHEWFLQHEN